MQILRQISRLFCLSALSLSNVFVSAADTPPGGIKTVVIDAGHGGHDGGAPSFDKKYWEKNINLDVSLKLADKIRKAYPDVDVILTRDKDFFVKLSERGEIANKAGADLFISIHVNKAKATSAGGFEIWCLGPDNGRNIGEIVDFENKSLELESDKSAYGGFDPDDPATFIIASLQSDACLGESLQLAADMIANMKKGPVSHSRGVKQSQKLVVLWKTTMPSILVEIGFISNDSDRSKMISEKGRDGIATALFNGFKDYKTRYDASVSANLPEKKKEQQEAPVQSSASADESARGVLYGTQIFAGVNLLGRKDKSFLGYEPEIVKSGNLYKYIIGVSTSLEEAKELSKEIKKKYPQSFLVSVDGEKITRVKK